MKYIGLETKDNKNVLEILHSALKGHAGILNIKRGEKLINEAEVARSFRVEPIPSGVEYLSLLISTETAQDILKTVRDLVPSAVLQNYDKGAEVHYQAI